MRTTPSSTSILRSNTARPRPLGNASASRHSTIASVVTQRLRQISVPGS
jgi:hypothetical protein